MKKEQMSELRDEQRLYPTPQKDGLKTEYEDGTKLIGGWGTRLSKWRELNLHRIPKPEFILPDKEASEQGGERNNIISDWLEEHGDPEITEQVKKEAAELMKEPPSPELDAGELEMAEKWLRKNHIDLDVDVYKWPDNDVKNSTKHLLQELLSDYAKELLSYHQAQWEERERELLISLVDELKDYTHESHTILGYDERTAEEFVEIFYSKHTNKTKTL